MTPNSAYAFWLDWDSERGRYTLGEEESGWTELDHSQLARPEIAAAQQRLRHQE